MLSAALLTGGRELRVTTGDVVPRRNTCRSGHSGPRRKRTSGPLGYALIPLGQRVRNLCRARQSEGGSMVQQLRLVVLLAGALIGGANAIQANPQAHQRQSPQ